MNKYLCDLRGILGYRSGALILFLVGCAPITKVAVPDSNIGDWKQTHSLTEEEWAQCDPVIRKALPTMEVNRNRQLEARVWKSSDPQALKAYFINCNNEYAINNTRQTALILVYKNQIIYYETFSTTEKLPDVVTARKWRGKTYLFAVLEGNDVHSVKKLDGTVSNVISKNIYAWSVNDQGMVTHCFMVRRWPENYDRNNPEPDFQLSQENSARGITGRIFTKMQMFSSSSCYCRVVEKGNGVEIKNISPEVMEFTIP